jgi:hypothetical protein
MAKIRTSKLLRAVGAPLLIFATFLVTSCGKSDAANSAALAEISGVEKLHQDSGHTLRLKHLRMRAVAEDKPFDFLQARDGERQRHASVWVQRFFLSDAKELPPFVNV